MATDCTNCKCWIRPFEPPSGCYDCCVGKIISYAKSEELEEFFNFKMALAERLFEISANDKLSKLSEFKDHLTKEEFEKTDSNFRNIESNGWDWITTTFRQRIESEEYAFA